MKFNNTSPMAVTCLLLILMVLPAPTPTPASMLTQASPNIISGRVTDSNGNGIGNVLITFAGYSSALQPVTIQTDENGNYSFDYTPDSNIRVTPLKSGYGFCQYYINLTSTNGVRGSQTVNFTGRVQPTLEPSGRLAFTGIRENKVRIYVESGNSCGAAAITYDSMFGSMSSQGPTWSPDGATIAFAGSRGGDNEIYTKNLWGGDPTALTDDTTNDIHPDWSPDGTRIVFASERDGNREIYLMNADGSNQTRLTNDSAEDSYPAWSPDNTKIAFTSFRDGISEIYVMNADGSGQTNSTKHLAPDFTPDWSPDGSKILFASGREGNIEIYVMNTDGTNATRLTNNAASDFEPAWSPDGMRIAFHSNRDGNNEVYIMNADGSSQTNITNHPGQDMSPAWSPVAATPPTTTTRTIGFRDAEYHVAEGTPSATITLTRSGDTSEAASVDYATSDATPFVRCDTVTGLASARCDYGTTIDTVNFAPGETQKTITVPITDDGWAEGTEAFVITLSKVTRSATLGQRTALLIITDNDAQAPVANPVDASSFFVRQHYLDFLSREPEAEGFQSWMNVLNRCGGGFTGSDPLCDRLTVSAAFFTSEEFQFKGYFVYRFYKATLGRLPKYAEIIPDMRRVTGQTGEEVIAKRDQFAREWLGRREFQSLYDNTTNEQFVDTLLTKAGITTVTAAGTTLNRDELISQLNGQTKSRVDVVRAVVESQEVNAREYNGAFVAMQYFGYLRRDPETDGYQAWLRVLGNDPQGQRTMVNGFATSVEYRLRFGQP